MKNRGQTTVLFACMISILLIFTLTALEVGRIYCGKIKIRAVIHSAQSAIMADYNRELFDRYHLLFIDPTYGTGSDAVLEERFMDYLDVSLNGNDEGVNGVESALYDFAVEEIAVADKKTITDDHMKLLKKQIKEYEKSEGLMKKAVDLGKKYVDSSKDIKEAGEKTERNAVETQDESTESSGKSSKKKSKDPRKTLKKKLKLGILALVLPANSDISRERQDFSKSVSSNYSEIIKQEKDNSFSDVSNLVNVLEESSKEDVKSSLGVTDKLVFCTYVLDHFSYQGNSGDGVMKCETEYILKGKDNDYDNLEAVVSDIIWMRMPINFVCLMGDVKRQSETLTLATAICAATATLPMVQIVKYLLLGCWSYGESIYEVKMLMNGGKIPYIKTPMDWNTDLKTLEKIGDDSKNESGMDYRDFLCILLVMKEGKDMTYARMLDIMEKNIQEKYDNFSIINLCGEIMIQGKVSFNPLLAGGGSDETYSCTFEEIIAY